MSNNKVQHGHVLHYYGHVLHYYYDDKFLHRNHIRFGTTALHVCVVHVDMSLEMGTRCRNAIKKTENRIAEPSQ